MKVIKREAWVSGLADPTQFVTYTFDNGYVVEEGFGDFYLTKLMGGTECHTLLAEGDPRIAAIDTFEQELWDEEMAK